MLLKASKLLHENNATYPDKINYYNPQHLSVEALELHYRINASILKYLELHEGKDIPNSVGNLFKEFLDKSYFPKKTLVKQSVVPNQNSLTTSKDLTKAPDSDKVKNEEIMKDVKSCVDDMLSKVVSNIQEESLSKKVYNEKEKEVSDVIMIYDSDDEQSKIKAPEENKASEIDVKTVGNNVQDFLDKMMEETMKKTEEQEPDSDTSLTSKNVVEVKVDDVKVEKAEDKVEAKIKSGSETETDIRVNIKFFR